LRYLDIAIAALVGMSAISGTAVWTPRSGDGASRQLMLQEELRDYVLAYLQQKGVFWLLQSPPESICSELSRASNASVTLSATIGPRSCGSPPSGTVYVAVNLNVIPEEVTVEAWSDTLE